MGKPGGNVRRAGGDVADSGENGDESGKLVADPGEVHATPGAFVGPSDELHAVLVGVLRGSDKDLGDLGDLVSDPGKVVDDAVADQFASGGTLLPLNLSRLGEGSTISYS